MKIKAPTKAAIEKFGHELNFDLSEAEIDLFHGLMRHSVQSFETLQKYDQRVPEELEIDDDRKSGYRLPPEEDPYNTWITRCDISRNSSGSLSGWKVAIKDNISVAGIEMTCGSRVIEGYVPKIDSTVVKRLLDAGATIIGKTNMDEMAFTFRGYPSAFGPVYNPKKSGYLAGGSSGGSAVAVATGEADLAIGSDQGGSIRIPASHCGIVGHKPTFGLVPYTGAVGLEPNIDHLGPMARTVDEVVKALTVIAGNDSNDSRQPIEIPAKIRENKSKKDLDNITIGVLLEGFSHEATESVVQKNVKTVLDRLSEKGATLKEISIPMHSDASIIHSACIAEELLASIQGEGLGHHQSWYDKKWADAFEKARHLHGDEFPIELKFTLLLGMFMNCGNSSRFYTRAMNLRNKLADKYDRVLSDCDVLAMPTTPQRAPADISEYSSEKRLQEPLTPISNTCAFNRTGHPALSVPVKPSEGLPIGLMLAGAHYDDFTLLNVGSIIENVVETL